MTRRMVSRKRLGQVLCLAALLLAAMTPARAQRLAGSDDRERSSLLREGGLPLPQGPYQGAWGEVVMATNKWIVVQNQQGQQFPIAGDAIDQFLIRWRSSVDALKETSVVEAFGRDIGFNLLATDHVDYFEGPERNLVNITYLRTMPNSRLGTVFNPGPPFVWNPLQIASRQFLAEWNLPLDGGGQSILVFLHIVGTVVNRVPLQLVGPGNNFANIVSDSPTPLAIFHVTLGDPSFAEKGDLVYMQPVMLTTRTVRLSQLVLYKNLLRRDVP